MEIDGPMKKRKQRSFISRFAFLARRKTAATVTEYAFIVAIVSIAAVVLLTAIGSATHSLLEKTNTNMPQ